ncbi:DinB family protein [Ktedonospora formicarum]|uniref:Damage-inducible protein DinB n=1 Tax=Ktedonospora formicarum TaxID=2778364 RepID=A0A8J3IBM2_9CHLR|nr:DinB family protein [Ktedonospora formicarum]GHO49323.1 hypothetical protein KSX_74860 [Ktedonospora formicarum]
MIEQPTNVAPFYQGWDVYQQHLVKAIGQLTPEQMTARIAPHLRNVDTIARHIISVRAGWSYFVLNIGDEQLLEIAQWGMPDQPTLPAAELVKGLQITWKVLQDALEHWTPEKLQEIVYDIDDETQEKIPHTRQWVIWHLIEHDLHHGGELSFMLGAHNIPAIDL